MVAGGFAAIGVGAMGETPVVPVGCINGREARRPRIVALLRSSTLTASALKFLDLGIGGPR